MRTGEGSRGGVVIGHTPSGNPIYSGHGQPAPHQQRKPSQSYHPAPQRDRLKENEGRGRHADFESKAKEQRRSWQAGKPQKPSVENAKEGDIVRVSGTKRRASRGHIGKVVGRGRNTLHVQLPSGETHEYKHHELEYAKSSAYDILAEFLKAGAKKAVAKTPKAKLKVKIKKAPVKMSKKSGPNPDREKHKEGDHWTQPSGRKVKKKGGKIIPDTEGRKKAAPEAEGKKRTKKPPETKEIDKFVDEHADDFKNHTNGTSKALGAALAEYMRKKDTYDQMFVDGVKGKKAGDKRLMAVKFVHDKLQEEQNEQGRGKRGSGDSSLQGKKDEGLTKGATGRTPGGRGNKRRGKDGGTPEKAKEADKPPEIITHRKELTPQADITLVPEELRNLKNANGSAAMQDHQTAAAALMLAAADKGESFLLGDGTGTGKTRAILAYADTLSKAKKKPVLVVTQNRVIIKGNIEGDASALGINAKTDLNAADGVVYCTYDDIKRGKIDTSPSGDGGKRFAGIVFDESQVIKNYGGGFEGGLSYKQSAAGRAAFNIQNHTDHVVYSSATPLDKTDNVFYLAEALGTDPAELADRMGFDVVRSHKNGQVKLRLRQRWYNKDAGIPEVEPDEKRVIIDNLFASATKSGKMVQREAINPHGWERNVVMTKLKPSDVSEIDDYGRKFKSAASAALHQRRIIEKHKIKKAVAIAKKTLKEGGQAVIYFENITGSPTGLRRSSLESLRTYFPDAGVVKGGGGKKNANSVRDFQGGKSKVILVQASYSAGISLDDRVGDAPRHLISMTAPLSAIGAEQMEGRTNRNTTKSKAQFTYLMTDHYADAWVSDLIEEKSATLSASVKGKSEKMDITEKYSKELAKVMQHKKDEAAAEEEEAAPVTKSLSRNHYVEEE